VHEVEQTHVTRAAHFLGPWDLDARLASVPEVGAGTVVMVESRAKGRALPWHRKKLVLVLAAQRHFAEELRAAGHEVELVRAASYADGIREHVARHGSTRVVALRPRDVGMEAALAQADLGAPLELLDDGGPGGHFLLTRDEFAAWARGRKQLRMDQFYAWMRKRTGLLMEGDGSPVGGKYSFDADNRKHAKGVTPPARPGVAPDALTEAVIDEVESAGFGYGSAKGFAWPVTRAQALEARDRFVQERLAGFGDYQDALIEGEPFLWHACVSAALNLSLLSPHDLLEPVLDAYERGDAPLNAVEGFIRQVLGWREFMRGVYHLRMPELREANRFGADQPLPGFYWDPEATEMACVRDAVRQVHEHGYAHHIQRLMVLGNYALLAGIAPLEVSHWFWSAFVDASEWVELPNVHGMALAADTTFTTKPYAASGAYINKMGDHCKGCRYDVKQRHGEDACPFNPLYWDFLARHREDLASNPRMRMIMGHLDRFGEEQLTAVRATAARIRATHPTSPASYEFHDDQG